MIYITEYSFVAVRHNGESQEFASWDKAWEWLNSQLSHALPLA